MTGKKEAGLSVADKILYELLTKIAVDKAAIIALMDTSKQAVYKALSGLKSQGLIAEHSVRQKTNGGQQTIDYLVLTPRGFTFLCLEKADLFPWLPAVSDLGRVSILGGGFKSSEAVLRQLRVSTAAMMCDFAGAAENLLSLHGVCKMTSPNRMTSPQNMETITRKAMEAYRQQYPETVKSDLIFADAGMIKRQITTTAIGYGNAVPDLKGGRYSGIIDSVQRTALIYADTRYSPLNWPEKFVIREQNAYRSYKTIAFPQHHTDRSTTGICLVPDVKAFARLYHCKDAQGKNHGFAQKLEVGKPFDRFFVVPANYAGVYELRDIMLTDLEQEAGNMIDLLSRVDFFSRCNDIMLKSMFPLVDGEAAYTTVCLHLDLRQIQRIEEMVLKMPGKEFEVFCRSWMIPYLEEVLPEEVTVYPLYNPTKTEINEIPLRDRPRIRMAVEGDG